MSNTPPRPEDLGDQLTLVACPGAVIWGLDNCFGPLDVGLLITKRFQNARMHIFPKCGHWAQVEHADEFIGWCSTSSITAPSFGAVATVLVGAACCAQGWRTTGLA